MLLKRPPSKMINLKNLLPSSDSEKQFKLLKSCNAAKQNFKQIFWFGHSSSEIEDLKSN